jgi:hypothetical protein
MIRKYQQGGAASSEDEQVVQILQAAIQNGLIDEQAAQ